MALNIAGQKFNFLTALKNNFCKDKGYILIRIPYYKLNLTIEELFSDKFIYKGDD